MIDTSNDCTEDKFNNFKENVVEDMPSINQDVNISIGQILKGEAPVRSNKRYLKLKAKRKMKMVKASRRKNRKKR